MNDFLVAEAAIRQLHARYVDAVWRQDTEAFGDCFAEDCVWKVDGDVLRGRADCISFMKYQNSRFYRLLLTLRTPVLKVENGTATGRTYFSAQNVLRDGTAFAPIGIYYERFIDQGDRWRFSWRLFQTHYAGPPDLSGKFIDNPDYGPPPDMPPRDAIPDV
jgi:hypothetical protein